LKSTQVHSHLERRKRKLQVVAQSCHKITEYRREFPVENEAEMLREDVRTLRKQVRDLMESRATVTEVPKSNYVLLDLLVETAARNSEKNRHGLRFDEKLKVVAAVIYLLASLQAYVCLSRLLPFPSVDTARSCLYDADRLLEGSLRFDEAMKFLDSRFLPRKVVCIEDATRIQGIIQYDHKTNQIKGFMLPCDDFGLPVPESYPATSARKVADYFETKETSNYAYCVMAQPLSPDCRPFCLLMHGTNQKFKAADIVKRWERIETEALNYNVEVVGFSADGDPRLLKSMIYRVIRSSPLIEWPWFQSIKNSEEIYVQDHIHLGTKLKTRLCSPSIILPFGKDHFASRGHLLELITNVSKDQHSLTLSDIDSKDKMNFKSVQKISNPVIPQLLISHVPSSEATAAYLVMINDVLSAFMDTTLTPLERVEKIWDPAFFVRIWRKWLLGEDGYTAQSNFSSANTYACIELNAHGLIQFLVKCRDSGEPHLFLPWLISSQQCESTFRSLSSTGVTHCGVVNFSVLELENRFRRIEFLEEAMLQLNQ